MRILLIYIAAGFLTVSPAQELITDRPDFTESAQLVPRKHVQFEMGIERKNYNKIAEWNYPLFF